VRYVFVLFSLLICLPLSAQEQPPNPPAAKSGDFWIGPGAEAALYGPEGRSYGGSLTIGYGSGTSMGIKASWLYDHDGQLHILVLDILFRLYFFGRSANSGLFIQLAGGPALYFEREENISFPARIGIPSVGLAVGWRFPLGRYFFLEPSIRGGYPYLAGAGLSAGVRF